MEDAGLVVREDVMGNIFGRWQGSNASPGAWACRCCQLPSQQRQSLCYSAVCVYPSAGHLVLTLRNCVRRIVRVRIASGSTCCSSAIPILCRAAPLLSEWYASNSRLTRHLAQAR